MVDSNHMADGWYIIGPEGEDQPQIGPLSWEELHGLGVSGRLTSEQLVWHSSLSQWTPASAIPNLLPISATAIPSPPRRRRGWLIPLVAALVVVVLGGSGTGIWLLWGRDGGGRTASSSSTSPGAGGSTTAQEPQQSDALEMVDGNPDLVVETEQYGRAAADQVLVLLAEGSGREQAEKVAEAIGGAVVGEIGYISLYQIKVASTTAPELAAAVQAAAAQPGVDAAFPNTVMVSKERVEGKKCSPLRDPLYDGENSRAYDMIGLQQAWDVIRASGVELQPVHVGVVDTELYTKSGQDFGTELNLPDQNGEHPPGKVKVRGLGPQDTSDQPDPADIGGLSHGTQVTHVMAADPGNGGAAGVLGTLGDKVTLTVSNALNAGTSSWQAQDLDPGDITQYQGFYLRTLVELKKQVDSGAKVINLSLGPDKPQAGHAWAAQAFKRFFEKMQKDHPDVLFVAAAGNEGGALDGSNYYPGGLKLPNVITVGALDQSGDRAKPTDWTSAERIATWYESAKADGKIPANWTLEDYTDWYETTGRGSNYAAGDGEVTLAACGTGVPTGVDVEGRPVVSNGTSFAAPQVAAAAALLRAINPKLTASEIKHLLTDTGNTEVEQEDGTKVAVPAEVGGRVLRVDKAVLAAINSQRPANDQFTLEDLVALGTVLLVAEATDTGYTVIASVTRVGPQGTDLTISMSGQGSIAGNTSRSLSGPGEVSWTVEPEGDYATIKVHRSDTKACAILQLEKIDLNGHWEGTLTITEILLSPELEQALADLAANPPAGDDLGEGCDMSGILLALNELEGKPLPLTMDITADVGGTGMATILLDASALGGESEPNTLPLTWSGNTMTIQAEDGGTFTGTATREGDRVVMKGTISGTSGEGSRTVTIRGVWTVIKQSE